MKSLWTTLKLVWFLREIENSGAVDDVGILWSAEKQRWVVGRIGVDDISWLTCNHIEPALRYFRKRMLRIGE